MLFMVIPVISGNNQALAGDDDVRAGRMSQATARFRGAFDEVPSNADFAYRAARAAIMDRGATPAEVRELLDAAVAADPTLVRAYLTRAEFERQQHNGDAVRFNFDKAVVLNPADTDVRLRYADALAEMGLKTEAAVQLRTALEFNDKLPIDEPERLPPEKVAEIQKRIGELS